MLLTFYYILLVISVGACLFLQNLYNQKVLIYLASDLGVFGLSVFEIVVRYRDSFDPLLYFCVTLTLLIFSVCILRLKTIFVVAISSLWLMMILLLELSKGFKLIAMKAIPNILLNLLHGNLEYIILHQQFSPAKISAVLAAVVLGLCASYLAARKSQNATTATS